MRAMISIDVQMFKHRNDGADPSGIRIAKHDQELNL